MIEQKQKERRFYMAVGIGTDFDSTATHFSSGARRGTPPPIGGGNFTCLGTVRPQHFSDVYPYDFDTAFYRPQLELGYVVNRHLEVFALFKYDRAGSRTLALGNGTFVGPSTIVDFGDGPMQIPGLAVPATVLADFGDYTPYGFEVGARFFLCSQEARLRPYLSIAGGATYVEAIDARFSTAVGSTFFSGRFYDHSVVATGSLLVGVEFALSPCFSLGAEGGLRYESALDRPTADLRRATFMNSRYTIQIASRVGFFCARHCCCFRSASTGGWRRARRSSCPFSGISAPPFTALPNPARQRTGRGGGRHP